MSAQKRNLNVKKVVDSNVNQQKTQNIVQKKEKFSQVIVKSERQYGSSQMLDYCKFLISPYESESVVEAPAMVPTRQTTVRQNIVLDLATYNDNGQFIAEVRPNLAATVSVTSGAGDTQDQGAVTAELSWDNVTSNYSTPDSATITHLTTGYVASMQNVTDAAGTIRLAFALDQDANTLTEDVIVITDSTSMPIGATLTVEAFAAGGNWTTLSTIVISTSSKPMRFTGTAVMPANCLGLSFRLKQEAQPFATPISLAVALSRNTGTGKIALDKSMLMRDVFGLPLQDAINDLQSWRVTAQDVLVTFEGDTLQDGGAIAAARVPKDWTPLTDDPYSELLLLPYDRYDGPLKFGAHIFWIPGSLDDVTPIDDPTDDANFGSYKMVVAGRITHPGASVRVRVCTAVAYFSTNPSYGNMSWAPPAVDFSLLMQYLARVVPVATSNDEHIIKKLALTAAKHAKTGMKYLVDHPEHLLKIATVLAELL
jgi:hypothetical protein